jgi:hypothetical protein
MSLTGSARAAARRRSTPGHRVRAYDELLHSELHNRLRELWMTGIISKNEPMRWLKDEGGSKNRRLISHQLGIAQVRVSRILTDAGEVAERLKAAVC